jgi:DNA-binding CsgD family transcriptional regulator
MSAATPAVPLFGRESEAQRLTDLVHHVRDRGGAIVVRGEAGIGKSALLAEVSRAAAADGVRILTAAGVESEAQLPFAGLHQLLRPVLSLRDELAVPQRDAVLAAFGMTDAAAPDLFLIALAALNMLAEAATQAPILLVVEDAHWLDRASADVLTFVARRLESEPVLLLAAIRDGYPGPFDDAGLPELPLRRLDDGAANALLDAHAPDLPSAVRERLLGEAAGNPLALVELPIAMGPIGGGSALPPRWLPLTTRLEQAFAARVTRLPAITRTLLLVGALNDTASLSETLDAAALVIGDEVGVVDLAPAVAVGLIEVDLAELWFRHPLMRSAIRHRASVPQRHAAHAALAKVLAGDEDRRVWHRAASSDRPDEAVAAELETAATRAQRRGGVVAAVAALEQAARLSGDPVRRAERLLRAADFAVELGRHDVVVRLLSAAEPLDLSPQQRARMVWIRGSFDDGMRDRTGGALMLARLAETVAADGDTDLAVRILWSAALRCFWDEPGAEARHHIVAVAEGLAIDELDPRLLAILAYAAPIERGAVVNDRLRRLAAQRGRDAQADRLLGTAAVLVGAFDLAETLSAASVAGLRAQGRLGLLARALGAQAWSAVHLVDLEVAIPVAEEASRLARETSQPFLYGIVRATEATLAALRGEQDRVQALAAEAEQVGLPVGARPVLATVQIARGLAALGDGRFAEAYAHLRRMHDPADPSYQVALRCYAIGELADAAVHCGQDDAIRDIVREMETVALKTSSPSLHAGLRLARALLADDAEAEPLFEAACDADLTRWPFVRARAQLAYGEWLRRRRRMNESRPPLRAARETFDALGAGPWSQRARQELRASGEASHNRAPELRDRLTPQELQIVQMAADGLTNREIGERLYLSHRTVSSHLHRVFPKLGVTSRAALGAAIRAHDASSFRS